MVELNSNFVNFLIGIQLSEKDLHLQTLQLTLSQYEAAYNQASEQYSCLQEHYQQAIARQHDSEQVRQL